MMTLLVILSWFFVILVISVIMIAFYRQVKSPGLKIIMDIILFFGVIIHEVAHACVLLCMGITPKSFVVRYRNRATGKVNPCGEVGIDKSDALQMSFMQGILVSLAPLFVSTFTFLFMLDVIFTMNCTDLIKVAAGVVMISILFGSAPSGADINSMMNKFNLRPGYSLYQLLLVCFSTFIVIFYIDLTYFSLPFEVLYYIFYCFTVIGIYYALKYIILLFKASTLWIIEWIQKIMSLRKSYTTPIYPSNINIYSLNQNQDDDKVNWKQ